MTTLISYRKRLGSLALALALGLAACDPEVEGCLDYRATAIDVTAGVACDDCCDYPTLTLQWVPARFAADTVQTLGRDDVGTFAGDTLRDPALAFYLHDVALERANGTAYPLTDTLTVVGVVPGEDRSLIDASLLLVAPYRSANNEIGTLLDPMEVVAVTASLGLPPEWVGAEADFQPPSSPLAGDRDSLLTTASRRLRVAGLAAEWTGSAGRDSVVVPRGGEVLRWALPEPVELARGAGLVVTLAFPVDALAELLSESSGGGELPAERFADVLLAPTRVLDAEAR